MIIIYIVIKLMINMIADLSLVGFIDLGCRPYMYFLLGAGCFQSLEDFVHFGD